MVNMAIVQVFRAWLVILPVLMVGKVECYSREEVTAACDSMRPGHLTVVQVTPPPYNVRITPRKNGYYVTVIGKSGRQFRGFLLQARDADGRRVGRFDDVQDAGRIISCSFKGGAVQHRDSSDKEQVTALWVPANFTGPVKFRATVVESYFSIWMDVESETLNLTN